MRIRGALNFHFGRLKITLAPIEGLGLLFQHFGNEEKAEENGAEGQDRVEDDGLAGVDYACRKDKPGHETHDGKAEKSFRCSSHKA